MKIKNYRRGTMRFKAVEVDPYHKNLPAIVALVGPGNVKPIDRHADYTLKITDMRGKVVPVSTGDFVVKDSDGNIFIKKAPEFEAEFTGV